MRWKPSPRPPRNCPGTLPAYFLVLVLVCRSFLRPCRRFQCLHTRNQGAESGSQFPQGFHQTGTLAATPLIADCNCRPTPVAVSTAVATATPTSKARKPAALLRLGFGIRIRFSLHMRDNLPRYCFGEFLNHPVNLRLQLDRQRLTRHDITQQVNKFKHGALLFSEYGATDCRHPIRQGDGHQGNQSDDCHLFNVWHFVTSLWEP